MGEEDCLQHAYVVFIFALGILMDACRPWLNDSHSFSVDYATMASDMLLLTWI